MCLTYSLIGHPKHYMRRSWRGSCDALLLVFASFEKCAYVKLSYVIFISIATELPHRPGIRF